MSKIYNQTESKIHNAWSTTDMYTIFTGLISVVGILFGTLFLMNIPSEIIVAQFCTLVLIIAGLYRYGSN